MSFRLSDLLQSGPPPGLYTLRAEAWEERTSQAGNPMIAIRWQIVDEGPYEGMIVTDFVVLTEPALWKAATILKAVGVPPETEFEDVDAVKDMLLETLKANPTVRATIQRKERNGTLRANITQYLPAESADEPPF